MLLSTAPPRTPALGILKSPFLPPHDYRDRNLTITTWVQDCERKTQLLLIPYSFHELLLRLPPVMDLVRSWCHDGARCPHLRHRDIMASYPTVGIVRIKEVSYAKGLAEALSHVTHGVSGDSFLFLHFLLAFQRPSELNQRQFRCMAVLYEAFAHGGPSEQQWGAGVTPRCYRGRG